MNTQKKFKRLKNPLDIDKTCSCGKRYWSLPKKHKVILPNEGYMDGCEGIWFDCVRCKTTLLIRQKNLSIDLTKEDLEESA